MPTGQGLKIKILLRDYPHNDAVDKLSLYIKGCPLDAS